MEDLKKAYNDYKAQEAENARIDQLVKDLMRELGVDEKTARGIIFPKWKDANGKEQSENRSNWSLADLIAAYRDNAAKERMQQEGARLISQAEQQLKDNGYKILNKVVNDNEVYFEVEKDGIKIKVYLYDENGIYNFDINAINAYIESLKGSQGGTDYYGWTQPEESTVGQRTGEGEQTTPVSGIKFSASDVLRAGETYEYKYDFDFEKYDSDLYKANGIFSSEVAQHDAVVANLAEQMETPVVKTVTEQLSSFKQFWNDHVVLGTIIVSAIAVAAIASAVFLAVPALTFSAPVVLGGLAAGALLGGIYVAIAQSVPSVSLPMFVAKTTESSVERTNASYYDKFSDADNNVIEVTGVAIKDASGVTSYTYTKTIKDSKGNLISEVKIISSSEEGPISYNVKSYDENGVLRTEVNCEDSAKQVYTKISYDSNGKKISENTIDIAEVEQIYQKLTVGSLSDSVESFKAEDGDSTLYPYYSFLMPQQNGDTTQLYDNSLAGIENLEDALMGDNNAAAEEVLPLLETIASKDLRLSDRDDENYVKTGEALWAGIFALYCRNSGVDFGSEENNARANAAIDSILSQVDDYLGKVSVEKNGTLGFEGMIFGEGQTHWVSTEHMLDAAMYYALKGDTASLNKVLKYIKVNFVNSDGTLKQGLNNNNQALDTYTWGYMMLFSIDSMNLKGVDIDAIFGDKFLDGLLDKVMSYQKADGTFGFSNLPNGVTSGEFTMQVYAALASAGREEDANRVLQSAIKAGLVVIKDGKVYVKYTTDADSGENRDFENYPVYSDRSLASTAWLQFGLEELQSNLNGGSNNIFTILNNGNVGVNVTQNQETVNDVVTALNNITLTVDSNGNTTPAATEEALLELNAIGQSIYEYYVAGNLTEEQRDQLYGFVQQKAMDIDLTPSSSVRKNVSANAVNTKEAIREVGYRQYTVTDGEFKLEETGSRSDKNSYIGKVEALSSDKTFQATVTDRMSEAILAELNRTLGINFLTGELAGKLVNKIIGMEAYQKTDDISDWSVRAVKNYFSTGKNFDDFFAIMSNLDKDQQNTLLKKLITLANKDSIANLINNIKSSKALDNDQKQELLETAYEKQIILASSLTDIEKIVAYVKGVDSSMLTDSQKAKLLKQAYEKEISIATTINQVKDIISKINALKLLDENTKASLLEQAYEQEIELSSSLDNIKGRIRDVNDSKLSEETKANLVDRALAKMIDIYTTKINTITSREDLRALGEEIFRVSDDILSQESKEKLFDAIERRAFALDMKDKSYVRQRVNSDAIVTKFAMEKMRQEGHDNEAANANGYLYPHVDRTNGRLDYADPYITRINNYITENNLEATVKENLEKEIREQFKKLFGVSADQLLTDEMIEKMFNDVAVDSSDTEKTWAAKAINSLFYDDAAVTELIDNVKALKLSNEDEVIATINEKYFVTLNERLDNATTMQDVTNVENIVADSTILTDEQKAQLNEVIGWYKVDLVDLLATIEGVTKVENGSYLDKSSGYWVGNSIVYPKVFRYLVTMKDGSSMYVYRYTKNGQDTFSIANKKETFEALSHTINAWQTLVDAGYTVESNIDSNKNQYFIVTKDGVSTEVRLFDKNGNFMFDINNIALELEVKDALSSESIDLLGGNFSINNVLSVYSQGFNEPSFYSSLINNALYDKNGRIVEEFRKFYDETKNEDGTYSYTLKTNSDGTFVRIDGVTIKEALIQRIKDNTVAIGSLILTNENGTLKINKELIDLYNKYMAAHNNFIRNNGLKEESLIRALSGEEYIENIDYSNLLSDEELQLLSYLIYNTDGKIDELLLSDTKMFVDNLIYNLNARNYMFSENFHSSGIRLKTYDALVNDVNTEVADLIASGNANKIYNVSEVSEVETRIEKGEEVKYRSVVFLADIRVLEDGSYIAVYQKSYQKKRESSEEYEEYTSDTITVVHDAQGNDTMYRTELLPTEQQKFDKSMRFADFDIDKGDKKYAEPIMDFFTDASYHNLAEIVYDFEYLNQTEHTFKDIKLKDSEGNEIAGSVECKKTEEEGVYEYTFISEDSKIEFSGKININLEYLGVYISNSLYMLDTMVDGFFPVNMTLITDLQTGHIDKGNMEDMSSFNTVKDYAELELHNLDNDEEMSRVYSQISALNRSLRNIINDKIAESLLAGKTFEVSCPIEVNGEYTVNGQKGPQAYEESFYWQNNLGEKENGELYSVNDITVNPVTEETASLTGSYDSVVSVNESASDGRVLSGVLYGAKETDKVDLFGNPIYEIIEEIARFTNFKYIKSIHGDYATFKREASQAGLDIDNIERVYNELLASGENFSFDFESLTWSKKETEDGTVTWEAYFKSKYPVISISSSHLTFTEYHVDINPETGLAEYTIENAVDYLISEEVEEIEEITPEEDTRSLWQKITDWFDSVFKGAISWYSKNIIRRTERPTGNTDYRKEFTTKIWSMVKDNPEFIDALNQIFKQDLTVKDEFGNIKYRNGEPVIEYFKAGQPGLTQLQLKVLFSVFGSNMIDAKGNIIDKRISDAVENMIEMASMGYTIKYTDPLLLSSILKSDTHAGMDQMPQEVKDAFADAGIDIDNVRLVGVERSSEELGDKRVSYTMYGDKRELICIQYRDDGQIDTIKVNTAFDSQGNAIFGYDLVYSEEYGYEVSATYQADGYVQMGELVTDEVEQKFETYREHLVGDYSIYDLIDRNASEDTELVRLISTPRLQTGHGQYTQESSEPTYIYVAQDGFIKSKELIKQYPNGDITVSLWGLNHQEEDGKYYIDIINEQGVREHRECPLGTQPGYFVIEIANPKGQLVVYKNDISGDEFGYDDVFLEYEVYYHELKRNIVYTRSGKLVAERYLTVVAQVAGGILDTPLLQIQDVTLKDGRKVTTGMETVIYDVDNMSFDKANRAVLYLTEDYADQLLSAGWRDRLAPNSDPSNKQNPDDLLTWVEGTYVDENGQTKQIIAVETQSDYEYTFSTVATADEDGIKFSLYGVFNKIMSFFNMGEKQQIVKTEVIRSEGLDLSVRNKVAKVYENGELINEYGVDVVSTWVQRAKSSITILAGILGSLILGATFAGLFGSNKTKKRLARKDRKRGGKGSGKKGTAGIARGLSDDQKALVTEAETYLEDNAQEMLAILGLEGDDISSLREDIERIDEQLDLISRNLTNQSWLQRRRSRKALLADKKTKQQQIADLQEQSRGLLSKYLADNPSITTMDALKSQIAADVQKALQPTVEKWIQSVPEIAEWLETTEGSAVKADFISKLNNGEFRTVLSAKEFIIKAYIKAMPDMGAIHDGVDSTSALIKDELAPKIVRQMAIGRSIKDIIQIELGNYLNDLWITPILGKDKAIEDLSIQDLYIWYKLCKESHFFSNNNSTLKFYMAYKIFTGIRANDPKFVKADGSIDIETFENEEVSRWTDVLFYANSEKGGANPVFGVLSKVGALKDVLYIDRIPIFKALSKIKGFVPLQDQIVIDDIEDYFRDPKFIDWYENGSTENMGKTGRELVDEYLVEQDVTTRMISSVANAAFTAKQNANDGKVADDKGEKKKRQPTEEEITNAETSAAQPYIEMINLLLSELSTYGKDSISALSDEQVRDLYSKIMAKYSGKLLGANVKKDTKIDSNVNLQRVLLNTIFALADKIEDKENITTDSFKDMTISELSSYNSFDKARRITKTHHDLAGGKIGLRGIIAVIDNYKAIFGLLLAVSIVPCVGLAITSAVSFGTVGIIIAAVAGLYIGLVALVEILKHRYSKENMGEKKSQWVPINPEDTDLVKDKMNKGQAKITKGRSALSMFVVLLVKGAWNYLVWSWIGVPVLTLFTSAWPALMIGGISFAPVLGIVLMASIILFFLVDAFGFFYIWEAIVGWVTAKKALVTSIHNWKGLTKNRTIEINGKRQRLSTFNAAKARFEEYLLPKTITDEHGLKRAMTAEEKEIAWMKHWNMIVKQWYDQDKISKEEMDRLMYGLEGVESADNYLALTIPLADVKQPDLSKPIKNEEIQDRLFHYMSTLFMDLEQTPEWEKTRIFSIMTPCNDEVVIYPWTEQDKGDFEGIFTVHESGFTLLNEQISLYPDEWDNFVARLRAEGKYSDAELDELESLRDPANAGKGLMDAITDEDLQLQVRLWVSYRYQPLARTIRGIMSYQQTYEFYAQVNYPTAQSLGVSSKEEYDSVIKEKVSEKFEYIVGHQPFGDFINDPKDVAKRQKALDVTTMMKLFPTLKVAYIKNSDKQAVLMTSKDVEVDETGHITIKDSKRAINLQTDRSFFGQGKPVNQNSTMKFVKGETVQFMDMNQDMDLEETFKQPGLVSRFDRNLDLSILGFPERIFTATSSAVGTAHAFADRVFNSITQRVLSWHGVRFHYGHPDFLNVLDVRNIGLIMPTNVNEDIQGAYKATLHGKQIENNETMRAAKGREGVFAGLLGINDKFISGAYQQAMTRYMHRVNSSSAFGFAKQFMHYIAALGYYVKKVFIPFILFANVFGILVLGLSAYVSFPSVLTFGILSIVFSQAITIPGLVQMIKEKGLIEGVKYFLKIWPTLVVSYGALLLDAFSLSTIKKTLQGLGDYVKTGRVFGRGSQKIVSETDNPNADPSAFALSQRSITLAVVLNLLNMIGFLLWANPGMWWSVFVILMPLMAILAPVLLNPASTPNKIKVSNWEMKENEDNIAISEKNSQQKAIIPIVVTIATLLGIGLFSSFTMWILLGYIAVYLQILPLFFKLPGLKTLKEKYMSFLESKNAKGNFRGDNVLLAGIGMIIFGETAVSRLDPTANKDAIGETIRVSYRQSFNSWFSMSVITKPIMMAISTISFWTSSIAYLFKTGILSRFNAKYKKENIDNYEFGYGLARHNDLRPSVRIVGTTLILLGLATMIFTFVPGLVVTLFGAGIMIGNRIGKYFSNRAVSGREVGIVKFFKDFFGKNRVNEGSAVYLAIIVLSPFLIFFVPSIVRGYKKQNEKHKEIQEKINSLSKEANEDLKKELEREIRALAAGQLGKDLEKKYFDAIKAAEETLKTKAESAVEEEVVEVAAEPVVEPVIEPVVTPVIGATAERTGTEATEYEQLISKYEEQFPNIRKELEIFENELLANKGKMIGVQFTDEKVREGFTDEDSVYLAIAEILRSKYGEDKLIIQLDGDAIYYVDGEAKKGKIFFAMHDGTISENDVEKMIRDANRAAELSESARLSKEDAEKAAAAAEKLESKAKSSSVEVATGLRYLSGEIKNDVVQEPIRPTERADVFDPTKLSAEEQLALERKGTEALLSGKVSLSMLMAGASSRMNVNEAPEEIRDVVESGKTGVKTMGSKAAVPITKDGTTYFGIFMTNIARLFAQIKAQFGERQLGDNEVLLMTNEDYAQEHSDMLTNNGYYGFENPENVRFFKQPLGAKYIANVTDAKKMESKYQSEDEFIKALLYSADVTVRVKDEPEAVLSQERDPLGHGEYFHQMVESGELLHLIDSGKEYVYVKNVDNYAAKFDKAFLIELGYFIQQAETKGINFLSEVSERVSGLKGGSWFVDEAGSQRAVEDPTLNATIAEMKDRLEAAKKAGNTREAARLEKYIGVLATPTFGFNDAVAFFSPDYVANLYLKDGQTLAEFLAEYREALKEKAKGNLEPIQQIAQRGRSKFPQLLDPKPAKKKVQMQVPQDLSIYEGLLTAEQMEKARKFAGQTVEVTPVVVKIETNMWQSTALSALNKVATTLVKNGRNIDILNYPNLSREEKVSLVLLWWRFAATKQWSKTTADKEKTRQDLNKVLGLKEGDEGYIASVDDPRVLIVTESYEGYEKLGVAEEMVGYIKEGQLIDENLAEPETEKKAASVEVATGLRYLSGEIKNDVVEETIRPTTREDVFDPTKLSAEEQLALEKKGAEALLNGEVSLSMLMAGASSRMNVNEAPEEIRDVVESGKTGVKTMGSKAAVPITKDGTTYFGIFMTNIARLFAQIKAQFGERQLGDNEVLLMTNEDYAQEHSDMLTNNGYYGFENPENVRFFKQPLGAKYIATVEDVKKMESRYSTKEDYYLALAYSASMERAVSENPEAVLSEERDPLGHGEYFHQMIESGELLHLIDSGKHYVYVKNVDNYAAKFDKAFLIELGYFIQQAETKGINFLSEVSERVSGLKGGSWFVDEAGSQRAVEDPTLKATIAEMTLRLEAAKKAGNASEVARLEEYIKFLSTDTFGFNDAVAFYTPEYVANLYLQDGQTYEEFIEEYRAALKEKEKGNLTPIQEMAQRGRSKFPQLLDPKPAKKKVEFKVPQDLSIYEGVLPSEAIAGIAKFAGQTMMVTPGVIKIETNMWQSTALSALNKVATTLVKNGRNIDILNYPNLSREEKVSLVLLWWRFAATKQWSKTTADKEKTRQDLNKVLGLKEGDEGYIASVDDPRVLIVTESYEGYEKLGVAEEIVSYIKDEQLVDDLGFESSTPATVAAQETKKTVIAPAGTEAQKTVINFLFKGVNKQLVFNFGTALLSTMQDGYRKLASIENNFLSQADLKNILEDKDHYVTEPVKESKGKAWELRTKDGIFIGKIITTENGNLALVTNKNKPITFKFNAMIGRSADANVSEIAYSLNKNSRRIFDLLDPNTQEHLIAAADYKFKNRILPNGDLIVRDKLVRFAVGDNVLNAENVSQTGLTAFDKAVAESVAAYRTSTNYSLAEMNELLLSRTFRGYQSVQRQEMYFKVTSKTNLEYIKKGNLLRSFESAGVTTLIIQEDSYTANLEEIVKYIKDHGFEVIIEVDVNNIDEAKLTSLAQAGLTGIRFVVKNDVTKENIGSVVNGLSETYRNKVLPLISNFRTIPAISYDFSNNRGRSSKLNISNEIIRTVAEFIRTNGLELVVDARTYVETEENYIAQGKDMNNLRDFVELRDTAKIVVRVSDKDAEDASIFNKIKKAGAVCAKTIETLKKIRVMDSLKNNARLNGRDYSLSDIFGENISELFINGGTSADLDIIRKFLSGQEPLSLEAYNRLFTESARKAIDDVIANNGANKNDKDVLTGFARDFVIGSMTKEIESLVIPSEVRSVGDNYKVLVGSALLMMINGVNINDITTEANKAVIDGSKSISQLLNESGLAKSILGMWKSEDMKISIEEKADTIALAGLIKLILTMDTILPEGESLMSSLDVSLDGIKGILAAA